MEQRISLISLNVSNLQKSREFYKKIGWKEYYNTDQEEASEIAFFQLHGLLIGLYDLSSIEELGFERGKSQGITLSINMRSRQEVDKGIQEFINAGGKVVSHAKDYPWGYCSYLSDLDGHIWEIAYVPSLVPDKNGEIWLDE